MRIALHNLGCKVNSYEFDIMLQRFQDEGYQIVGFDEEADIYLVNTCSVTNIADRKSRQMLHRAKNKNPDAVVVAVGCYVQTDEGRLKDDLSVDLAVGNNRKKDIVDIVKDYLVKREKADERIYGEDIIDINHTDEYEEMKLIRTAEHTRAYIKIQDGCNQFCTYCIIPYARGRVRSRKEEDILAEVKDLVKTGYKEIVVTGIHISSYGIDFEAPGINTRDYMEQKSHLPKLMEKLNAVEGLERIRLGSLEPRIITAEFVEKLSGLSKLCPHFHLSLQSGCDATLKRMNRHYTTAEYADKVALLRNAFPDCAVTTDVITGFPGETEEEFEKTRQYLESLNLYEMHVFKYSKRHGTKAAVMPNQLTEAVKASRSDVLLQMTQMQSEAYRKKFIGKELSVLFEEKKVIGEKEYFIGHSKEYLTVVTDADTEQDALNSIMTVKAENMLPGNEILYAVRL